MIEATNQVKTIMLGQMKRQKKWFGGHKKGTSPSSDCPCCYILKIIAAFAPKSPLDELILGNKENTAEFLK